MPNGPELLAEHLRKHRISKGEAAKALNVTRVTLWKWLKGTGSPLEPARADIAAWTNGDVPMGSWGKHCDNRGSRSKVGTS